MAEQHLSQFFFGGGGEAILNYSSLCLASPPDQESNKSRGIKLLDILELEEKQTKTTTPLKNTHTQTHTHGGKD